MKAIKYIEMKDIYAIEMRHQLMLAFPPSSANLSFVRARVVCVCAHACVRVCPCSVCLTFPQVHSLPSADTAALQGPGATVSHQCKDQVRQSVITARTRCDSQSVISRCNHATEQLSHTPARPDARTHTHTHTHTHTQTHAHTHKHTQLTHT